VGQSGKGTTHDSDAPVPVTLPTGTTVAGIAAGDLHSLALTSTGQVLAWGFGLQGELGNGTFNSSDTPVMAMLPLGTTVRQLSAGCEHTLALTSTGQVLAWGFNADGQLVMTAPRTATSRSWPGCRKTPWRRRLAPAVTTAWPSPAADTCWPGDATMTGSSATPARSAATSRSR